MQKPMIGDDHLFKNKMTAEVQKPDQDALERSILCLIRHGTTEFNVKFQEVAQEFGLESEEYKKLKANEDLIDPPINELGLL
jgi:hypothetical protein